jgi:hypothetical protein
VADMKIEEKKEERKKVINIKLKVCWPYATPRKEEVTETIQTPF